MPLSANAPRAIENPDIPFDKFRYSVQIGTSVDAAGKLHCGGTLVLVPCRVLPPAAGESESRWEDDPRRKAVLRPMADLFALAAEMPEVQAALEALHAAVAKYNQLHHCV
jgi:hypothetical protein